MNDIASEIRANVLAYLTKHAGQSFTIASIAKALHLGIASVRYSIGTLENDGSIKRSSGERQAKFYIQNERQRAMMEQKANGARWPDLKPRREHSAVMERIRAERNSIASIG